jgi:hypothetical protein
MSGRACKSREAGRPDIEIIARKMEILQRQRQRLGTSAGAGRIGLRPAVSKPHAHAVAFALILLRDCKYVPRYSCVAARRGRLAAGAGCGPGRA